MTNEIENNGVMIVRTPGGVAVATRDDPDKQPAPRLLLVELECDGQVVKREVISSWEPWRDCIAGVDMLRLGIRVKAGELVVAELKAPDAPLPFMVRQGEQQHITESYVSVPPALTITDVAGDVWTLGFEMAPKTKSPGGEFAFPVLKNGKDTNEIASRIEMRAGKVKIFTKQGWKTWSGQFFF